MGHTDSENMIGQGLLIATLHTVSAMGLSQPPANTLSLCKTRSDESIAHYRARHFLEVQQDLSAATSLGSQGRDSRFSVIDASLLVRAGRYTSSDGLGSARAGHHRAPCVGDRSVCFL